VRWLPYGRVSGAPKCSELASVCSGKKKQLAPVRRERPRSYAGECVFWSRGESQLKESWVKESWERGRRRIGCSITAACAAAEQLRTKGQGERGR
jgi:hypothetical protein